MSDSFRLNFPLKPHETATSYVSRLMRYCGVEDPRDFCLDFGFRWQDYVRGDDHLFERVARMGGAQAVDLKRWAVRTIAPHQFRVAGQEGIKSSLVRSRLRVCPRCLVKDRDFDWRYGAYQRHYWHFTSMRTCHIHRCPIMMLPHERYTLANYDVAGLVFRHWNAISDEADTNRDLQPTDLEDYLRVRLGGQLENPFLDAMPMYIATRLCEVLGFVLLCGPKRKISDGTDVELSQAGQIGFDALRSGEEGLYAALESLVAPAALRTVHHQADLGALFEWLRSSNLGPSFEPLKDLVRDFIFRTYPIPDGHTVLGKSCAVPSRYSIHGAWQSLGIQRKRMNRVLIDEGLARFESADNCVHLNDALDAREVARIAARIEDRLTVNQVCKQLGVSADVLRQLRERAILRPVTDALDQTPKYERSDVSGLLKRLSRRVTVVGRSHQRLVRVIDAARRVRCPTGEIIDLMLRGQLQSIGCDKGGMTIDRFRICVGELRSLLPVPELPGRPKGEVARQLRVTYPTINYLIEQGVLSVVRARNPKSRQFIDAVTSESIAAFETKYVTLGALAQQHRRAAGPLGCHLEAQGICPIETPPKISWYYERRGLHGRLRKAGIIARPDVHQHTEVMS